MEYLTYDRFIQLGGSDTLPLADFKRLQLKYGVMIDYYTFGRIDHKKGTYKDLVESCIVEMITEQSKAKWNGKDAESKGVKSETVGDYSVTYQSVEDVEKIENALDRTLIEIVRKYFLHTGLMYRGRL